jgi:hypothetical protein
MPFLITLLCAIAVFIHYENVGRDSLGSAFFTFIIVGVVFIVAYSFIPISEIETEEIGNIKLVALNDNLGYGGSFYLGCGNIETGFYYTYGYMRGGELVPGIIQKTDDVHLYPNRTDNQANIYTFKSVYHKDFSWWPISFIFSGAPERVDKETWTEIRVPPNSVIQNIVIDSK